MRKTIDKRIVKCPKCNSTYEILGKNIAEIVLLICVGCDSILMKDKKNQSIIPNKDILNKQNKEIKRYYYRTINVLNKKKGNPSNRKVITDDDITNLSIKLNTVKSVDEFIKEI